MKKQLLSILLFCMLYAPWAEAQDITHDLSLFDRYSAKCDRVQKNLSDYTSKQLKRIQRLKQRLYSKLDSARSDTVIGYGILDQLDRPSGISLNELDDRRQQMKHYIGFLDSFQTGLKLRTLAPGAGKHLDQLKQLIQKSGQVQDAFKESGKIEGRLVDYLQALEKQLPTGRALHQLRQLQNAVGDYQLKIRYYKEILSNPDKTLREAFALLKKTRVFQQFFRRYSAIAAFLPPDPTEVGVLEPGASGLQTRELVRQAMYDRVGPNVNTAAFTGQKASEWKSQLQQLKSKIEGTKSRPLPEDIQGNPNAEKSKSFLKRLQVGTNLQSVRSNGWMPATTDFGLSVGFKLNGKSIVGIGGSYKLGWGENIRNIRITHQGASLRSFIDWKIKGSFYCSGGYEYNYQPVDQQAASAMRLASWKNSGLIGISKTIAANHKFFKQAKMQVLWDALARQQLPRSPSFKFRIGYNLN